MSNAPGDRPLSELSDAELHQEGMRGLRRQLQLDPTNANINPRWLREEGDRVRARLDEVDEEVRRRGRARRRQ